MEGENTSQDPDYYGPTFHEKKYHQNSFHQRVKIRLVRHRNGDRKRMNGTLYFWWNEVWYPKQEYEALRRAAARIANSKPKRKRRK